MVDHSVTQFPFPSDHLLFTGKFWYSRLDLLSDAESRATFSPWKSLAVSPERTVHLKELFLKKFQSSRHVVFTCKLRGRRETLDALHYVDRSLLISLGNFPNQPGMTDGTVLTILLDGWMFWGSQNILAHRQCAWNGRWFSLGYRLHSCSLGS